MGHLWQNRYYSTPLDERHLWTAVRYIEMNPVRAGLIGRAELYDWSSAKAHCTGVASPYLAVSRPFPGPIENWSNWLAEGDADIVKVATLRHNSRTGWPTGSPEFVARLASQLGRPLVPADDQ